MNNFVSFLDRNRLKKSQVADYLGVSNAFVTKLCNGLKKLPADKLASLRANPDWDTSMFQDFDDSVKSQIKGPGSRMKSPRLIPLLPFSAVAGFLCDNNGAGEFRGDSVGFPDFSDLGADCAIRVGGDSMWPRYNNGDVLAIRIIRDGTFFQWGRVYVLSTTQGCVVKRLFPDDSDPDRVVCHSENSALYPDYSISKTDILALAIVVGHAGVE